MTRRLSIGARWTLRFTLALLVTVSLFAAILYSQLVERTDADARAFLSVQVQDLAAVVMREGPTSEAVATALDRSVRVAEADYKLGLRVYDSTGKPVRSGGSLARANVPLPDELRPLAPGDDPDPDLFHEVNLGAHYPFLVVAVPVPDGAVQGALYKRRFVRTARDLRNLYYTLAPVVLLLTAGIAYWLARASLRPIQEITAAAQRISGTRLEETVPVRGSGDELDLLAGTLNEMLDRIRAGMARARRFAANAAHELRTPLGRMRSRLEVMLAKERSPEEYHELLTQLAAEVEGLSEAVHGLMRLAQSEAGLPPDERVEVDLGAVLREVVGFFEPLAQERGVELVAQLSEPLHVPGEPSWLHQLFANLVHNGIKYTAAGGRVEVTARARGGRAEVTVRDTGVGIPPEEATRVFEPFHRVGATPGAPGVGLGLPLAREIARAHGGEIALETRPGEGASFRVSLPRDESAR